MIILMVHVEDVFNELAIYTMTCTVLHACGCYLQFNRDASRIAFLHNASNCSTDTTSLQAQNTASSSDLISVSLVTMDVTGKGLWVLPLKDVVHYEYGRGGKLIVSTQHGLFEADALGHSIQELKPPTTGQMLQSFVQRTVCLHVAAISASHLAPRVHFVDTPPNARLGSEGKAHLEWA